MKGSRKGWEDRRERGYETAVVNYTERRYGNPSMQAYAEYRTFVILQELQKIQKDLKSTRMLDVGCGTGVLLNRIVQEGNCYAFGIDYSARQLSEAKENIENINCVPDYVRASAFDLPFADNSFDVVASTRFIHQYPDDLKAKLISEIKRCLRPGGVAVVEFYSFFPWLVRFPFVKGESLKDYFRHCTTRKALNTLVGKDYSVIPLRVAGSSQIDKLFGARVGGMLQVFLKKLSADLFCDEKFVVFEKR